ncbi:hypothetical protein M0802_000764 [Mischocyttarus mexicanus]|nr:hypothetical protein M0802_000764 [Mischocyttarus mexicanus]
MQAESMQRHACEGFGSRQEYVNSKGSPPTLSRRSWTSQNSWQDLSQFSRNYAISETGELEPRRREENLW